MSSNKRFVIPLGISGETQELGKTASALGQLDDVDITNILPGQTLVYENGKLVPKTLNNVPDGGLAGQLLMKNSEIDGDYSWVSPADAGLVGASVPNYDTEYWTGYAFNYISPNTWSVVGYDATKILILNRRLKFADGANTYFGSITAVDYNSTNPGDTTITMAMEDAEILSNSITDVALTVGVSSWSTYPNKPIGNIKLNRIASGNIGGTFFNLIVGDNGKILYSTSAGSNWGVLTTPTGNNLTAVAFHEADEYFLIMATTDEMYKFDGVNLTTVTIITRPQGMANGLVRDIHYVSSYLAIAILYEYSVGPGSIRIAYSTNAGRDWAFPSGFNGIFEHNRRIQINPSSATYFDYAIGAGSYVAYYTSFSDNSYSSYGNLDPAFGTYHITAQFRGCTLRANSSGRVKICPNGANTNYSSTQLIKNWNAFAYSDVHDRVVGVGDDGQLATLEAEHIGVSTQATGWVTRTHGMAPMAAITDVHWDKYNNMFIIINDAGQISLSINGLD